MLKSVIFPPWPCDPCIQVWRLLTLNRATVCYDEPYVFNHGNVAIVWKEACTWNLSDFKTQ